VFGKHRRVLLDAFPNLELLPVTRDVVLEAAAVRARYRLRTPDALLLATGLLGGATAAATNDAAWKAVAGLDTRLLSDMAPTRAG
jgi:predicted nucleic acid-binding protein